MNPRDAGATPGHRRVQALSPRFRQVDGIFDIGGNHGCPAGGTGKGLGIVAAVYDRRQKAKGQEKAPFPAALLDLAAGSAARTGNVAHVARLSKKSWGEFGQDWQDFLMQSGPTP